MITGRGDPDGYANKAPKTIAILQSNYLPWKGYFDIIAAVDEFLIFDEVQFTRRDWRNRNRVIINGTVGWLTIPVHSKGKYDAPINAIEVSDPTWASRHWQTLKHGYSTAPFFRHYEPVLEKTYSEASLRRRLTEINELFLRQILANLLGLKTTFLRTEDILRVSDSPTDRLIEICRHRGAQAYLSGPAAKTYIDPTRFTAAGIALHYANYEDYPSLRSADTILHTRS